MVPHQCLTPGQISTNLAIPPSLEGAADHYQHHGRTGVRPKGPLPSQASYARFGSFWQIRAARTGSAVDIGAALWQIRAVWMDCVGNAGAHQDGTDSYGSGSLEQNLGHSGRYGQIPAFNLERA